jgi:hypothetical protein
MNMQQFTGVSSPILTTATVRLDATGSEKLFIDGKNIGTVPIRGYVLVVSFVDSATSENIRTLTAQELCAEVVSLDPGGTWHSPGKQLSRLATGEIASVQVRVDLVVFADGSTWGPAKSPRSHTLLNWFSRAQTVALN